MSITIAAEKEPSVEADEPAIGRRFADAAKRGFDILCALPGLLLLPLTYAILHLSYGSGFLWGLFKFRKRWGDKIGNMPAWRLD